MFRPNNSDDLQTIEAAENAERDGKRQLWERQIGESPKAFDAFRRYRDLAERRTFAKVAQELGCSSTNVERWARRWCWTNRVYAFDLAEEEKFREQISRDRLAARRRQIQLGAACLGVAAFGIRELQAKIAAGQTLDLAPEQIAALLKVGIDVEGKGMGEEKDARHTRIVVNLGDMRYAGEACGCRCAACAACHGEAPVVENDASRIPPLEGDDDPKLKLN